MADLLSYFARRVVPQDDAADCLSETLLVLWRKRRKLPASSVEVRAWSFGNARNVLANYNRGRLRRNALADRVRLQVLATGAEEPEDYDLLDALQADDRELIRLIVWDGFGVAEAGALIGIKPGAARMRYSRAKGRLRQVIVESDVAAPRA